MRSNTKWLRALCKSIAPIYVVNDAQRIVYWNAAAKELLGYSEADVLNQPCYQIIAGMVCGKSWCHAGCTVQRSSKRGILLQNFEMQALAKCGDAVSMNTSVFTLERGGRRFSIHLLRDMTREEHTREALESILDTLRLYGGANGEGNNSVNSGPPIHPSPPRDLTVTKLTRREIEVLELLAEGLSTRALAQRLGVSRFTVRRHIETILLKTGLHTQAQAVSYAYRSGLL